MKKLNIKTQAHINSLDGKMDKITIIAEHYLFGHKIPNAYIVDYKGTLCTAIYNVYVNAYYVDDKYGVLTQYEGM